VLDVQPAPAAEQAQQSAEAAPVIEAEQTNKAKTGEAVVVAEKAKTEKAVPEAKPPAGATQKSAAKQKTASGAAAESAPVKKNREIRARHILVATREEAERIIVRLQGGADFGAIARDLSTDPTARSNSGELGFFRRGMMVKPFEEAAFAMPVGQFSREPVQTQFGWHVIHVEEEREIAASE